MRERPFREIQMRERPFRHRKQCSTPVSLINIYIYIYILVYIGLHIIVDPAMSPMPPAVGGGSASSRFRHPQIQLRQLPERGAGYVATGASETWRAVVGGQNLREPFWKKTCREKNSMKP